MPTAPQTHVVPVVDMENATSHSHSYAIYARVAHHHGCQIHKLLLKCISGDKTITVVYGERAAGVSKHTFAK